MRRQHRLRLVTAFFALSLSALAATAALAGPSKSVRVTTYKDFAEGQETGVLITSQGEAQSGFSASRLALPSLSDDSVRALAVAEDGAVFLGTGGEAPSILSYEKGALRKLARLEATTWVTALRSLPAGALGTGPKPALLAATAQDGRLFLVGRDGSVRVFARLGGERDARGGVTVDHVWDLRYDAARHTVYAVTGPGKLWAVDAAGKAEVLFDSGARQILSLDLGDDGLLYVGTADDAVLYRIDPRTRVARALHDFSGNELRALVHRGATVYAAVNDMQRSTGSDASAKGIRITPVPTGTAPGTGGGRSSSGSSSSEGKSGKGALYRIDPDGRVEQLHAITDGFFNAIQVDADGGLYAAASTPGGRGRVYHVRPDRTVLTALELKESDVLSLNLIGPTRLVGTGNSAALYQIGDAPPSDANYLSKVFDAQYAAQWGSVRFAGTGPLTLQTRSGNLVKPDATWSPWQPLGKLVRLGPTEAGPRAPAPFLDQIGEIASPGGRYLQVRVLFGVRAVLQHFVVSYQPLNQRPRVTEILVGEEPLSGIARGPRPSAPSGGSVGAGRPAKSSLVKLRWKVENPDEDELCYYLSLRRQPGTADAGADSDWLRLGGSGPGPGNDPLLKTEYEWNIDSVPDGIYELRVVASDERANPQGVALRHELVSSPFVVDNRRPEFQSVQWDAASGQIAGRAVDSLSPLSELSYSVDGGDFLPLSPRDGVLDEPAEEFVLRLGALPQPLRGGTHTVVLRAVDAADNAATTQLVVRFR